MKKRSSLLLMICLIFSLAACGSNTNDALAGSEQQTAGDQQERSGEELGSFNKSASLDETVMVDENGVKITATGLNYTDHSVDLELSIENSSGKDLSFSSGTMGYHCNSINGYMVSDGYLNCDVADGKKANETISFSYDALMLYGIDEIADMEIGFTMSDDDYNDTYSGPRQLKTSAFDAHDYGKDHYQETIKSRAAMNTYGYDMTYFSQDPLYEENGIKLCSSGVMVNQDGRTALLLELENTTSDMVHMTTSDIAINGLVASSVVWSSDTINPGKRGIIDVELSEVLNSEYWSVYGIQEVGSVTLSLSQYDAEGKELASETPVEIVVPDTAAEHDAAGDEVYHEGGLRIVAKTVLEDPSGYSSDLHVLLLAENKSGKTLTIDYIGDSLSVNGVMTDAFCEYKELADGESAALEILLWGSSLETNQITAASDVKEVEIGFEIKAGSNDVDDPTVKITFD